MTFTVQNKQITFNVVQQNPVSITAGGSAVTFNVLTSLPNYYVQYNYVETLIGTINGTNKIFTTTYSYVANSTMVFINGLLQTRGTHYIESGDKEITFDEAPTANGFEDELIIIYIKE